MGILLVKIDSTFENDMYLYIFYCLLFVVDISTDMVEKKVMEETDP